MYKTIRFSVGRCLGVVISVVVLAALPLTAQGPNYIGVDIGYRMGEPSVMNRESGMIHRAIFSTLTYVGYGYGTSLNHTLNGGVVLGLPALFGGRWGIELRGAATRSWGYFESYPYVDWARAAGRNANPRDVTGGPNYLNQFDVSTAETAVGGGILVSRSEGPWSVSGGLWLSSRLESEVRLTERVLTPEGGVFTTVVNGSGSESSEHLISEGDSLNSDPFRYGVQALLSRRFPLSGSLELRPYAGGDLDVRALFEERVGIRSFSFRIGVVIALSISSDPVSLSAQEIPDDTERRSGAVSVDLYNALPDAPDPDRVELRLNSTRERRFIPIPSLLRFGSDGFPGPYATLSRDAVDQFEADVLSTSPVTELLRRVPDIIGMRLRREADATLTLHPVGESAAAEAYRDYLIAVWGIDGDRLRIGTPREHIIGTPSEVAVALESSAASILSPYSHTRLLESYDPLQVGVRKELPEDGGAWRWNVTLQKEGVEIGTFDRESDLASLPVRSLVAGKASGGGPTRFELAAGLVAVNPAGDSLMSHDRISVDIVAGDTAESFLWIILDSDDDPELDLATRAFVEMIVSNASPERMLTIRGPGSGEAFGRKLQDELKRRDVEYGGIRVEGMAEEDAARLLHGTIVSMSRMDRD